MALPYLPAEKIERNSTRVFPFGTLTTTWCLSKYNWGIHSVKTFYTKLTPLPPKRLPCALQWEQRFATSFSWEKIWCNIYGGLSMNWEGDITWRFTHGIVKMWAYHKSWCRLAVNISVRDVAKKKPFPMLPVHAIWDLLCGAGCRT